MGKAATTADKPATVAAWKRLIKTIKERHRIAVWIDHPGDDVAARRGHADRVGEIATELAAAEAGLREAERRAGASSMFLTQANLAALERLTLEFGGPRLGTRLTDRGGHIERCVRARLVEWDGYRYRLTKEGRVAMADRLIQRISTAPDTEDVETIAHWELTLKALKTER